MKSLVFAEKPSVAKELARVLKCGEQGKGYFEGKNYIVTWALGHLATLLDPEDYDAQYKTWTMESLPIIPPKMKVKVLKEVSHQYRTVSHLMKRKDVSDLVIATDAGREGELVARWTMLLAGFDKPFKRLWISSQTDKAILEGFANLKPGKDYDRLFHAAVCRAEADWLIGLNLSRALTCQYNAQLSAGRVQTPTLNMIVEREDEIQNFKPVPYWEVKAEFDGYFGNWRSKENTAGRIFDQAFAESLKAKVDNKKATVISVESRDKSEMPPLAYDLTELQRDANNRYGFSAKKTLQLMQILYEKFKIVTYPRTDSRYITTDIVDTLRDRLLIFKGTQYERYSSKILQDHIKPTKRFVDNEKVSDHHAIIPTEEKPNLAQLSNEEMKIYDLIVRRFFAVLMPDSKYKELKIITEIEGEHFHSKGKEIISLGWKEVTNSESNSDTKDEEHLPEQALKEVRKGDKTAVKKINLLKGHTKPPGRYTEADLLSRMEKGNLGTPATRAEIIEKIISSFYVERTGRQLSPTSKGKQLVNLVPEMMRSADLTSQWENYLEQISKGKADPAKFNADIRTTAKQLINEVKTSSQVFKLDNVTKEKCPVCGKYMLTVKDKRKRDMLICQDRECGHRENTFKKREGDLSVSKRDKVVNKKLIAEYADNTESTGNNLGELLKAFMEKK